VLLRQDQPREADGGRAENSLWRRNIELSTWTVPLNGLLALLHSSPSTPLSDPLRGFERSTWALIAVNGFGGLLVAVVIKYADNIWKGFATAGAILLTGLLAPLLELGPPPNALLLLGAALVVASVLLYAATPPPHRTAARAVLMPGARVAT